MRPLACLWMELEMKKHVRTGMHWDMFCQYDSPRLSPHPPFKHHLQHARDSNSQEFHNRTVAQCLADYEPLPDLSQEFRIILHNVIFVVRSIANVHLQVALCFPLVVIPRGIGGIIVLARISRPDHHAKQDGWNRNEIRNCTCHRRAHPPPCRAMDKVISQPQINRIGHHGRYQHGPRFVP